MRGKKKIWQQRWSCPEAARICGVTHRNAMFWATAGLVIPEVQSAGTGSDSQYNFDDLIALWIVGRLAECGVNMATRKLVLDRLYDSGMLQGGYYAALIVVLGSGLTLEINLYQIVGEITKRVKETRQ